MFENWDSFFLLIGGAAGGLIGLLFIVVTLMQGGDGGLRLKSASVHMTPAVAHLAMVLIAIRNAWDLVTWITARGDQLGRRQD